MSEAQWRRFGRYEGLWSGRKAAMLLVPLTAGGKVLVGAVGQTELAVLTVVSL